MGKHEWLQNNTDSWGIEELDWEAIEVAPWLLIDEWNMRLEPIEIDDDEEYDKRSEEGSKIGCWLSSESEPDRHGLRLLCGEQEDQIDEGSLKLHAILRLKRYRTEHIPEKVFGGIDCNEHWCSWSQPISTRQDVVDVHDHNRSEH